jgi:hypothetical protein
MEIALTGIFPPFAAGPAGQILKAAGFIFLVYSFSRLLEPVSYQINL